MKLHRILPSIHIHPILIVFILISFLTGTFMELSIILIIVLIHELGHYFMANYFKWRIHSIMLWVFGGVMDTDEHGNRPIREDVFVTIAGPLQHILIYIALFFLSSFTLLPEAILDLIFYYNTMILLFNLIPIWPLDGGKLLMLIGSRFYPFKRAYYATILISLVLTVGILIIQFIFFPFTLSAFLIFIFLLAENRKEWQQRYYVFIRFLLKRYKGDPFVREVNSITVPFDSTFMELFSKFRREQKHPIFIENQKERRMVDEMDCLHCFFQEKRYNQSVGEAFMEDENSLNNLTKY